MNFSRRSRILLGVIAIVSLAWWFYPREPLPLGYRGTGLNPDGIPGVRPTVECPINTDLVTRAELLLDGKPFQSAEATLQRNKKIKVKGRMDLGRIPVNANLLVVQLSIASKSKNAQGMLIEGETMLYAGTPKIENGNVHLDFDKEWLVPDHAGEFNLLMVFFLAKTGEREAPRQFAIVCPVVIE